MDFDPTLMPRLVAAHELATAMIENDLMSNYLEARSIDPDGLRVFGDECAQAAELYGTSHQATFFIAFAIGLLMVDQTTMTIGLN